MSLEALWVQSIGSSVSRAAVAYGHRSGVNISALVDADDPLHLDRGDHYLENNSTAHASWKYDDVFVDLYLLAGGSCSSYGVGGFGQWASLLSRNRSCSRKRCPRKREEATVVAAQK